jgi:hypothetical protein
MPDTDHENQQRLVFNRVEDAVVADADTEEAAIVTLQHVSARWARIRREAVDCVRDPAKGHAILDLLQIPLGSGLKLDVVRGLRHKRAGLQAEIGFDLQPVAPPTLFQRLTCRVEIHLIFKHL